MMGVGLAIHLVIALFANRLYHRKVFTVLQTVDDRLQDGAIFRQAPMLPEQMRLTQDEMRRMYLSKMGRHQRVCADYGVSNFGHDLRTAVQHIVKIPNEEKKNEIKKQSFPQQGWVRACSPLPKPCPRKCSTLWINPPFSTL